MNGGGPETAAPGEKNGGSEQSSFELAISEKLANFHLEDIFFWNQRPKIHKIAIEKSPKSKKIKKN